MAASSGYAQDTTKTVTGAPQPRQSRPGFDLPDSLYRVADTLGFGGGIDTIVAYTAKDSIVFDVNGKRMILVNDAEMIFQGRTLNAYTIVVDFSNSTLTAYSSDYDSVIENSLSRRRRIIRDTSRVETRGAPILREGDTPYEGEVIVYNFKTRKGTVQLGTSTMEGGFYYGERIKQVDRQTLFVENGRFTTCDAPIPHYYFESPRMKVQLRDKVFAAPVYMFVSDVPIFALPFGLFPNQGGGRRSGLIAPNYNTQGDRGWGLTHLGYYQVFSDYFDAAIKADMFTIGGYKADLQLQFMRRYWLQSPASIEASYGFTRFREDDPFTKTWMLGVRLPNLILGLFTTLNANLRFESSDFRRNTSDNINDLLNQSATSNASFNTQWEVIGVSLGIGYERTQNLRTNEYSEVSPNLSLTKSTFFPFAPGADAEAGESHPLQSLGISYSLSARRTLDRDFTVDSTYKNTERYGIMHNPSISISPKLGYFTVTPSFSYSEAWFFRKIERNARLEIDGEDTNTIIEDVVTNEFDRAHRYSLGIGIGTTLFGTANIGLFGVNAIRHTVRPNIGFAYTPDFSDQEIREYVDPRTGSNVRYNIFDLDLNNRGTGFGGESGNFTFGLDNAFEAKINRQVNKDSTTEEKVNLLNIGASSAYDAIQKRIGDLNITASSAIASDFRVSGSATFSFYPETPFGAPAAERTLIALKEGFLRPIRADVSLSGNFSSGTSVDGDNIDSLRRLFIIETPEDERAMLLGAQFPGQFVYIPFRPTWNISYFLSYTRNYIGEEVNENFSARADFSFALTRNWNFITGASYDFKNKQVLVPSLRITRDLHCWEMNFDYYPTGIRRGFNFEIRVKADQLRDIKLTRQETSWGTF